MLTCKSAKLQSVSGEKACCWELQPSFASLERKETFYSGLYCFADSSVCTGTHSQS